MGFDPLPAIGISSKKSCDEPNDDSPSSSLAHFFYSRALGTADWGLGIGDWGLGIGDWGLGTHVKYN
ncbi:hypothetical protein [Nostoc sp.]|uniref:hypothetical protein n=1 Tax=Nostoc sp. TaxID=1180 RepID=UPI002FF8EE43